jgi:tetratricopeptide (TPR) repeat protein
MKTKKVIFVMLVAILFSAKMTAQQELTPQQDSIRLVQTSVFQQNAKVKNYEVALKPWEFVYENYPASSQYIYSEGANILKWQISQAKTAEEKNALIVKLMKLYDDRITYFGTNKNQPTPWILGMKAIDYINFHQDDKLKKDAYGWLSTSVYDLGDNTQIAFIQQLINLSNNIYLVDKTHGEQYIKDYIKSVEILSNKEKTATDAQIGQINAVRGGIENVFINSGVADCATLESIYNAKLEENKNNMDWLSGTIGLFKNLKCTESPTYFKASMYAHTIAPTAESAIGVAEMSYRNKDYAKAVSLLEEAVSLSQDNNEKAEAQYKAAFINYQEIKNFSKAREFARAAIVNRPNWGAPYLLISRMYAETKNISDEPLLNNTVFWAAVETAEKAKRVDASATAEANQLINAFTAHFPRKSDLFFLGIQEGDSYTVPGWINESVIVKTRE